MSGPKYITGMRHIVVAQEIAARINELNNLLLIMTLSLAMQNAYALANTKADCVPS
jgi:hypothetical protein